MPPDRVFEAYADASVRRRWFRIPSVYEVIVDGRRRWVSLVTIELSPLTAGTQVTHTEQYAFPEYTGDGARDVAHLHGGVRLQLNGLAAVLEPRPATV